MRNRHFQWPLRIVLKLNTMQSPAHSGISDIFKSIEGPLEDVKALIQRQLSDCAPAIRELVSAFSSCSGKMLRPALLLLSGRCFGDITDNHIHAAAIVQMIHNATLLHDDVIDQGKQRRGSPTINSIWGNETAVLFGDLVLSKASLLCAKMETDIFRTISIATSRVCAGELRQILQRNNCGLSESGYIEIITEKSASLFAASCQIGAALSGADEVETSMMAEFGLHTGIAFQITDDLLDIVGDEKQTGKTGASDFDRNKLTLAVIHLLGILADKQRAKFIKHYLGVDTATEIKSGRDNFIGTLDSWGSLDYVRTRAQEYVSKAIGSLKSINDSDPKAALVQTAKFVASRSL